MMVKIFVKCIKAKQVHLNQFHLLPKCICKIESRFQTFGGRRQGFRAARPKLRPSDPPGLRDPNRVGLAQWVCTCATHLGCATHAEPARPTQRQHSGIVFERPDWLGIDSSCLQSRFSSITWGLQTYCVIIHGFNMQMKDLNPHYYEIIVFRVKMKIHGVKNEFDVLKQWCGQPSIKQEYPSALIPIVSLSPSLLYDMLNLWVIPLMFVMNRFAQG